MADSLELKEVELDYEAEEEDRSDTPRAGSSARNGEIDNTVKEDVAEQKDEIPGEHTANSNGVPTKLSLPDVSTDLISSPSQEGELDDEHGEEIPTEASKDGKEIESGEELEDGEISDEDEALKNERLEPKAVCRFFSKGQCTWGSSCRFLHPGVLDKGNYSMFAAPRPILPGESGEDVDVVRKDETVMVLPPVPEHESAWERGMRQAKEMRRRSNKRREMDVEYEEKKTSQSLTQVELDKENDYYTRPASPAHTHDPHAEDGEYYNDRDPYDTYHPEVRRIAPPPPPEFIAREERERSRYHHHDHPPGSGLAGSRPRRIAPPRSPSPGPGPRERYAPAPPHPSYHYGPGGGRIRGGEDWADPWMRGGPDRRQGGGGRPVDRYDRKRSYSSGSSRSSSGSSRSRSPRRRRRYSSSYSSRSSSRSRSRSSTPAGIPRREGGSRPVKKEAGAGGSGKSTAPLQKRLAGAGGGAGVTGHRQKERRSRDESSEDEGDRGKSGQDTKSERNKDVKKDKPREPFKMNIPKNQIKLSLKGAGSSKPTANSAVLEKLGVTKDDFEENKKSLKRKSDENTEAFRQQQKLASMKSKIDAISKSAEKIKSERVTDDNPADAKKLKGSKDEDGEEGLTGADTKNRREELLKQLRAVEKAIHKKRSKLDK